MKYEDIKMGIFDNDGSWMWTKDQVSEHGQFNDIGRLTRLEVYVNNI